MNLFADDTKELLSKYVHEEWAAALSHYIHADTFIDIRSRIGQARKSSVIYPAQGEVFKALSYPLSEVKVVIVGQDPYHNGNADGLAFSCKMSLSPSLQQILRAMIKDISNTEEVVTMSADIGSYLKRRENFNLSYLADQGVMLYNPTLTVQSGSPGSHKGLWDEFTKAVFQVLSQKRYLLWMLWGNDARDAARKIPVNPNHFFLYNMHPAASAHQGGVWSCDHFSKANLWLKNNGFKEIKWLKFNSQ